MSLGRILFVLCAFVFSSAALRAAHLVGGEMSYECLGNGLYSVQVIIYRDCNSTGAAFDDSIAVSAYRNLPQSGYPIYADLFLKHGAVTQLPSTLNNPCLQSPPNLCTEFTVYSGTMSLPSSNSGYLLAHQRCCRNNTVNNVPNSGIWGNTFTTTIPSNDACNSSPRFNDHPPVVMCQNDQLNFDHSAADQDGDSLYYRLCNAFHGGSQQAPTPYPLVPPPYTTIPYTAGLNAANPIPSSPPISIDPQTGLLTGQPTVQGQYLFTVCVEEYDQGVLLSTVRRDFQINVANCQGNVVSRVTPQIQLSDPVFCNGRTVSFEHSSTGGQSFLWEFNDPANPNDTSTLSSPTYTFSDTGVYTVYLIANPNTPCADTSFERFELRYPLEPEIQISGQLCLNDQNIQLEAKGNFSSLASFEWTVNGQNWTGQQIGLSALTGLGPHSVRLRVEDFNCIAEDSTEFTLRTKPGIFGDLSPMTGCAPLEVLMDDSSSSEPWTRHRWDFGDGQFSDQPTPLHTYQQAGVYTVTHSVWSDTACIDSAFNRYFQRIDVLPAPRADLWVDTQRVSIYTPQFVFRDSSSSDAVQWGTIMDDGTEYLGEKYWVHAYADTGTYTVSHWVLAANGCSDTVLRTLRVDAEFRVFIPNAFRPNDDGRNEVFRPYGADWRKMELIITDRWGGVVFRTADPLAGWNGRRMNQGQLLPEGIYAYRVLVWGKRGHFAQRMGTVMLLR